MFDIFQLCTKFQFLHASWLWSSEAPSPKAALWKLLKDLDSRWLSRTILIEMNRWGGFVTWGVLNIGRQWMVDFRENPNLKWMIDLGVAGVALFQETSMGIKMMLEGLCSNHPPLYLCVWLMFDPTARSSSSEMSVLPKNRRSRIIQRSRAEKAPSENVVNLVFCSK